MPVQLLSAAGFRSVVLFALHSETPLRAGCSPDWLSVGGGDDRIRRNQDHGFAKPKLFLV